jgi:predicted nucleotidyltransferase
MASRISLEELHGLDANQRAAIREAGLRLREMGAVEVVLFGSAVHGRLDEESDIDLLVVFPSGADVRTRDLVSDELFELNARHSTNLSATVIDHSSRESEAFRSLALLTDISAHGIPL